jgi:hypothetical protein
MDLSQGATSPQGWLRQGWIDLYSPFRDRGNIPDSYRGPPPQRLDLIGIHTTARKR